MTLRRARAAAALLFAAVVALAGCTGVPSLSSPEVVTAVGGATPTSSPAIAPVPGADPRTIVSDFLAASATDDVHHQAARGFLSPEALQRWSDTTVTVLDATQVSNFVDGAVIVTGRRIGTIAANGIYTPALQGYGAGGIPQPFQFGMKLVGGQWRIDTLLNGVIIDDSAFQRLYAERPLYFFDLAERHLVADLRYTAISDPALLANWLVGQLASGARPELQTSVRSELPAQTDPSAVHVVLGSTVQVQIPGAGQLDPDTRNRLAAEVAFTVQPAVIADLSIVDSGRAVAVPLVHGTTFTPTQFAAYRSVGPDQPALYYLAGGHLLDVTGHQLPGRADGQYNLTAVAVSSPPDGDLHLAGIAPSSGAQRLYVGTQNEGLRPTQVHGSLSRPAWSPDQSEVWVGSGSALVRVPVNSDGVPGRPVPVPVTSSTGNAVGRVSAVRFSPEGTRIALVLIGTDGSSQVWVGSVVRGTTDGAVTVDGLTPISPQGVTMVDIAWNGQLTLFAVGRDAATSEPGVFELQVDGSLFTPRGNANLPGQADSITVAENQVAWVSTGLTVWEQHAGAWISPLPGSTTGSNPVYAE
jgi:hypothetical protein